MVREPTGTSNPSKYSPPSPRLKRYTRRRRVSLSAVSGFVLLVSLTAPPHAAAAAE